jgi:hypothetical protein
MASACFNLVRGEWQCADAKDRELVATDLKNVRALL